MRIKGIRQRSSSVTLNKTRFDVKHLSPCHLFFTFSLLASCFGPDSQAPPKTQNDPVTLGSHSSHEEALLPALCNHAACCHAPTWSLVNLCKEKSKWKTLTILRSACCFLVRCILFNIYIYIYMYTKLYIYI